MDRNVPVTAAFSPGHSGKQPGMSSVNHFYTLSMHL